MRKFVAFLSLAALVLMAEATVAGGPSPGKQSIVIEKNFEASHPVAIVPSTELYAVSPALAEGSFATCVPEEQRVPVAVQAKLIKKQPDREQRKWKSFYKRE